METPKFQNPNPNPNPSTPHPDPPRTLRRSREVSSRYLSSLRSPLPSHHPPLPKPKPLPRRSPNPFPDENRPIPHPKPRRTRLFPSTPVPRTPRGRESGGNENWNESGSLGDSDAETCSVGSQPEWCESPVARVRVRDRTSTECRASAPSFEVDNLPVRCSTDLGKGRAEAVERTPAVLCRRSLNSVLSGPSPFGSSAKSVLRPLGEASKVKPSLIQEMELRKVRKGLHKEEEVHQLKMLHNQYLQWRFVNGKAEAAMEAQRIAAEKTLHAGSIQLSKLCEDVMEKRIELARLQQLKALDSTLEVQNPYLEEWKDNLEAEHSDSLSGITTALNDVSLQLPLVGNAKVDYGELNMALGSARDFIEASCVDIWSFLPQAGNVDDAISNLSSVACKERALVEECGDLLSEVHRLQVAECSLRGMLMQLKRDNRQDDG